MVPVRRHARGWLAYLASRGLLLAAAILEESLKSQLCSVEQKKPYQGIRKRPPAKAYEDYDHASDGAHQTAEELNWRKTNRISIITLIFYFAAAFATGGAFLETRRQADIAQQQIEATIGDQRPILEMTFDSAKIEFNKAFWSTNVYPVLPIVMATNVGKNMAQM